MGIEPTPNIFERMIASERKKFGRRGMTKEEALHRETTTLERRIHDQFSGFCRRHDIIVWHSNPTRKSSIRSGLPDYLCLKNNQVVLIEFKILGNSLSPLQDKVFGEIAAAGNEPVYICTETQPGAAYSMATQILQEKFKVYE